MSINHVQDESYISLDEADRIAEAFGLVRTGSIQSLINEVIPKVKIGGGVTSKIKKIYTGAFSPRNIGAPSLFNISAKKEIDVIPLFLARLKRGPVPDVVDEGLSTCEVVHPDHGVIQLCYTRKVLADQARSLILDIITHGGDDGEINQAHQLINKSISIPGIKNAVSMLVLGHRRQREDLLIFNDQ